MTTFAATALVMSLIGVYGSLPSPLLNVLTKSASESLSEPYVPGSSACLREGAVLVLGMVVGMAGVLGLTRYVKSILYGVSATDPMLYLIVAAGLIVPALLAMLLPARKAATIDPMIALRHD